MKAAKRMAGRSRAARNSGRTVLFEQLEPRMMLSGSPLASPSLSASAASTSQINLAWNRVTGATSYLVDELVAGSWKQVASLGSGSGSFNVTGLQSGVAYSFEVDAKSASSSALSNVAAATTLAPPAAPNLKLSSPSSTEIDLSWSSVAHATGYYVNEWIGKGWTRIATLGGSANSYAVTKLAANSGYSFEVAAYNSVATTWSTARGLLTLPVTPTLTVTPLSGSEIELTWNSVASSGFVVDEWNGSGWTQLGTMSPSATGYLITGLNSATTYEFKVGAFSSGGTAFSAAQYGTTFATAPVAPDFTATAVSETEIDLAWNTVTGATSYVIEEWNGSAWVQIATVGAGATSYAATGLYANTTYYFEVGASNAFGTTLADYQSAETLNGGPLAPTLTATTVSTTEIDLSWSTVDGATGYFVYEWNGTTWTPIADLDSSATSYAVNYLSPGTTYYFELVSYNAIADTWGNFQEATTLGNGIDPSGFDDPTADVAYSNVTGTLFGANGPSYLDVRQGAVGDCWFLASLAAVAARDPGEIQSMFTYQGTGTDNGETVDVYDVRLYDTSGVAHEITVDTELPAGGEYYDQVTNGVLWVALAEKAYAEANGMGLVTTQYTGLDMYDSLDGGYPSWALQAITGKSSADYAINPANAVAAWNAGEFVVLCTPDATANQYIVGDHAYAMIGYNAASATPFTMYNPWGTDANGDGWYGGLYEGHLVYGQFNASAATISANFDLESFGSGTQVGPTGMIGGRGASGVAWDAHAAAVNLFADQLTTHQQLAPLLNQNPMPGLPVDHIFENWGSGEVAKSGATSPTPTFGESINQSLPNQAFEEFDRTFSA